MSRGLLLGVVLAVLAAAPAVAQEVENPEDFVLPLVPGDFVLDISPADAVRTIDPDGSVRSLQRTRARGRRLSIDVSADVLFEFDKARLTPSAQAAIDRLARRLGGNRGAVLVEGHTDSVGSTAYNRGLSTRRARAVANALPGSSPARPVGRGESQPVAPNTRGGGEDNPAGRARNRRVTITARR